MTSSCFNIDLSSSIIQQFLCGHTFVRTCSLAANYRHVITVDRDRESTLKVNNCETEPRVFYRATAVIAASLVGSSVLFILSYHAFLLLRNATLFLLFIRHTVCANSFMNFVSCVCILLLS